ncbi:MAG: ATP synthase subunit I [Proteobacteria bacterium]|nr:ATP synthase subunit I [Pseudomonadota bacterium]
MRLGRSLHAKHALLVGLAFGGAIAYGLHAAASLLAGGGIQVLNLKVLERGVRRLVGPAGPASGALGVGLNSLRFVLFIGLVLGVAMQTPVRHGAFAVGLLLVVPALIWQGVEEARRARTS